MKSLTSVSCLVVYVKQILSSAPCGKHVHHTTAASHNGMHWHVCKDSRSTKISCSAKVELSPFIHDCSPYTSFQLLLEVDLDSRIVSAVFLPPLSPSRSLLNIKHIKKFVNWNHFPCRRRSNRTVLSDLKSV